MSSGRQHAAILSGLLALAAASAACGDPECERWRAIPVDAIEGTLQYRVPADACRDFCAGNCTGDEGDGLVCRPLLSDAVGLGGHGFGVRSDLRAGEGPDRTDRRTVEIRAGDPWLVFSLDLPDPRTLEGTTSWTSNVGYVALSTHCELAPEPLPRATASGQLRVVSRVGGPEGADGVTRDYHAVYEVVGHIEAVRAPGVDGECLVFPTTDFTLTLEEDHVERVEACPIDDSVP